MAADRGELEARIAECDAVLASEAETTDPESRVRVASAMGARVYWLMESRRVDSAINVADELLARFSDERDFDTLQRMSRHVIKAGDGLIHVSLHPLRHARRPNARPARIIEVLVRISTDPLLPLTGASRLWRSLSRGSAQRRQTLLAGIRAFDLAVARLDGADDSESRSLALEAKMHTGIALLLLGRLRSARALWEEMWASGETELPGLEEMLRREEQRGIERILTPLLLLRALILVLGHS